ncbi:hypothetical protein [Deinococcus sp.]|uniref:hypothetical protein n=1 Tax=Deinococcus sp. TaxID=47478 RepID=UPI003C7BCCC8
MTRPDVPAKTGGERGFELDTQLRFVAPVSRALALETLRPWGLVPELYGQSDEIRGARLTGDLEPGLLHELLRAGAEGRLLLSAEVGRRGFLRSVTGATEWMPWRRNVVLSWSALESVALEDGLRYLLE